MTKGTVDEGIHAMAEWSSNLLSMRLAGCFSDAAVLTGVLKKFEGCR